MSGRRTRVLLVEDDAPQRELVEEALRFLGHEASSAANGEQALRRLEREPFDLVLTDHRMPILDGLGLVGELRARRFHGRIYVLSGALGAVDEAKYRELGGDVLGVRHGAGEQEQLHRGRQGGDDALVMVAPRRVAEPLVFVDDEQVGERGGAG